ncbi:hypothetical protein [Epilithonimonas arachidiradicis]|uniref:Uncharacterized protein n=1 Tax=Epilithonimonas arachidiradicis TaxID=1617282 RepID=A0A420CMU8_9FLAO|nr:hypothetical protein [Epilithonimonas arachidiradicis]RKE79721.1 hypothetical protein BXY58_3089 [Epilithonimonas arachidiradicis]GGG52273.1 hypothetical protein GCM10007332_12450 [Epilithonimonas arachidiradicis]
MLNLLLILLGLISNPSDYNTSNCGNDGNTPTIANPNPAPPTGGDTGHPIPPKIIGG